MRGKKGYRRKREMVKMLISQEIKQKPKFEVTFKRVFIQLFLNWRLKENVVFFNWKYISYIKYVLNLVNFAKVKQ